MKKVVFFLVCVCLALSMPSFAAEIIVYENDYNDETPGSGFGDWNWIDGVTDDGFVKDHNATYEDDGTGNIVVDHNGFIDNSAGTTDVNSRFGSQWSISVSGNTSSEPDDYIIEFDIKSVSGNWDPIALEFFVITSGQGYGSGDANYAQTDGWVHVEMSLADLPVPWWQGTNWDLKSSVWTLEVGGPPYPGTTVPAHTAAWNQIWQMDNLKITQIGEPSTSQDPDPQIGAQYVNVNPTLSWTPGAYAVTHDIYLGTDVNNVNDANRANPLGVLDAKNYSGNTYGPNTLQFATTYYWRIDDVNEPNIYKGDVWSFTTTQEFVTEIIVYQNDYNNQNPGAGFPAWNWIDGDTANGFVKNHAATYQDYSGNIVVDHNATINNSAGSTSVNCRFGSKWDITVSGNTSSDPGDYTIEFDLRSVSGNWDPITLEFFVLTYNPAQGTATYGYGSGGSYYAQSSGWVHVEMNLSELSTTWWQGTNWDLTYYLWSIEVGGPPYPGTAVPAYTPAWNQVWIMDNLKITEYVGATSYDPFPPNGATRVKTDIISSWTPGVYAVTHDIYLGTDEDAVSDANRANPLGVLDAKNYSGNTYEPNDFNYNTTYYWRVDDVNEPNIYIGEVWSFTTQDTSLIDHFDYYRDTGRPSSPPPEGTLRSVWIDGYDAFEYDISPGSSGSVVQLNTDSNDCYYLYIPCDHYVADDNGIYLSEGDSMKLYYDNDGTIEWQDTLYGEYEEEYIYTPSPNPYLSEVYAAIDDDAADTDRDSLDMLRDWSGYNVLALSYYGDPNNAEEGMYVRLEDSDGTITTIEHPGPLSLKNPWWEDWYIALSEFTTASGGDLDLSNIVKIYIGIGDADNPQAGGSGMVFFDEIQLFVGVCLPDIVDANCDLDGDCTVNNSDLRALTIAEPWYGEKPVSLPTPIIDLDASDISQALGSQVNSWTNDGSKGGAFTDFYVPDGEAPVLEMVDGKKAVTFEDINDMLIWDQNAPGTITGANDFTVVYEVYNPVIGFEEWVIAWTERSEPEGTFAAFGYGTSENWGVVAHWTTPDMGFGPIGVPSAHKWHTIAVTYDGAIESILVDGVVYDTEAKILAIVEDQPVVIGDVIEPAAGGRVLSAWNPNWNIRFTGSVASIKVYEEAIPAVELALSLGSPADFDHDDRIDFRDVAILGNNWLVGPVLFGQQ